MEKKLWADYYKMVEKYPPSQELFEAVKLLDRRGRAADLGAGTPRDSDFLLREGFDVTAVDMGENSEELFSNQKSNPKFKFVLSKIEDFDFDNEEYDLVSAQRALSFIENKADLLRVVEGIKKSLSKGGIFTGNFFGPNDSWVGEGKPFTFLSKDEVQEIFDDMEVLKIEEDEYDGETAKGTPHHWHEIDIIAVQRKTP